MTDTPTPAAVRLAEKIVSVLFYGPDYNLYKANRVNTTARLIDETLGLPEIEDCLECGSVILRDQDFDTAADEHEKALARLTGDSDGE